MFSLKELKSEWKKIVWPGKKELAQKTGIVIIVCAIFTVIIGVYDLVFFKIRNLLEDLLIKK